MVNSPYHSQCHLRLVTGRLVGKTSSWNCFPLAREPNNRGGDRQREILGLISSRCHWRLV